jgi:hypothetical protein
MTSFGPRSYTSFSYREKADQMKRAKLEPENPTLIPLSYAQVVSPLQHGVKRTTSEREALSPIECCPKRTVRFCKIEVERSPEELTPVNGDCCSAQESFEQTPENCSPYSKAHCGRAQRRLFTSPRTGQLTPTSPVPGSR